MIHLTMSQVELNSISGHKKSSVPSFCRLKFSWCQRVGRIKSLNDQHSHLSGQPLIKNLSTRIDRIADNFTRRCIIRDLPCIKHLIKYPSPVASAGNRSSL